MLHKKLLTVMAISGLILFIGSIGLVFYRARAFPTMSGANHALSLENPNAVNQSETCHIYWKIDSYESSMMEGGQQTLIARVNSYCTFKVQVDFNLQVSGFDLSKLDGTVPLDPGASGSTSWLVTANKTGAILINAMAFSPNNDVVPENTNSEMLNISVTTIFGLNPQLLQVLSSLGTFLGPMLTAPWWYEQWQKYREKKKAEGASGAASSPTSHTTPAKKRKYARSHR